MKLPNALALAYFSKIQEGEGEVADSIWADISTVQGDFSWLGSPPTKEEIQRAMNEMDTGRAPGIIFSWQSK